jgi:acyl-CoA thioesterase FadM
LILPAVLELVKGIKKRKSSEILWYITDFMNHVWFILIYPIFEEVN